MGIANQLLACIALAVGTTYLLDTARKRIYALCTAIPWAFVVLTVFTAGIQSIQSWWQELATPGITAADVFSVKLMCVLAGTMLVLTGLITLDAMRRWVLILRGAPQGVAELQPAAKTIE